MGQFLIWGIFLYFLRRQKCGKFKILKFSLKIKYQTTQKKRAAYRHHQSICTHHTTC